MSGETDDLPAFNFSDPEQFARFSRHLATLKGVYRVKLEKVRDQRSGKQNAYYWAVVLPHFAKGVRDAWGYLPGQFTTNDAHEFCKDQFLTQPVVNTGTGELKGTIRRRTRDLDTAEFSTYVEQVRDLAASMLNVQIPDPTKYIDPPPPTLDDGPDAADREIERAADTPRRLA